VENLYCNPGRSTAFKGAVTRPRPSSLRCVSIIAALVFTAFCVSGAADPHDRGPGGAPVVFWASDPILPGQTALLFGDSIGRNAVAEGMRIADAPVAEPPDSPPVYDGRGEKLSVLMASDLSAKVLLPAQWENGLYAVRLKNDQGESAPIYLNRTEAWWWIGGSSNASLGATGDIAVPGEEMRVFGKNFGPKTVAWLVGTGSKTALPVVKAEKYALTVRVPASVAPGAYEVWVHNGYGGLLGFGKPLAVQVGKPPPWPQTLFNVRDCGARGDYIADDTAAFIKAIEGVEKNGGGIVYVPRGRYRITGKLSLPAKTILRGEARELTWLVVPKICPEFDAVIAGNGDFAVENLSIVAKPVRRLIMCPDVPDAAREMRGRVVRQPGRNVHLSHLRLQHFRYDRHIPLLDPRHFENLGPTAIALYGPDMWLNDVDVTPAGCPLEIHDAWHSRVENCMLKQGRGGGVLWWNMEESVYENNISHTIDLQGSYGGVQQNADRLYIAGNQWYDGFGLDREVFVLDSPYYAIWIGTPPTSDGNNFTVPEPLTTNFKPVKDGALKGQACLVVNGKGLGQYQMITGNVGRTVTVEHPWAVPLDQTSVVTIQAHKSQVVITRNRAADASITYGLYSQGYGIIIDGNQAERTAGSWANGWDGFNEKRGKRHYSCCMFNQWINNEFTQGFIYDQSHYDDGRSSGAVVGPLVSVLGLSKPIDPPHAVMAIGNILRGNRVSNQTTLVAAFLYVLAKGETLPLPYVGRDTVFEDNQISDTAFGINIAPYFIDSLVRDNIFDGCATNIQNKGVGTVIINK